jgi:hypothetical protein
MLYHGPTWIYHGPYIQEYIHAHMAWEVRYTKCATTSRDTHTCHGIEYIHAYMAVSRKWGLRYTKCIMIHRDLLHISTLTTPNG